MQDKRQRKGQVRADRSRPRPDGHGESNVPDHLRSMIWSMLETGVAGQRLQTSAYAAVLAAAADLAPDGAIAWPEADWLVARVRSFVARRGTVAGFHTSIREDTETYRARTAQNHASQLPVLRLWEAMSTAA